MCIRVNGQITIDGTITDSEFKSISDVLVEIIDQNDTSNYYRSFTNESGYFSISNITDIRSRKTNVPSEFIVLRNYPNPFNPTTIIYYELPKTENIEITIYDILGREVRTLFNNFHNAGTYTFEWDGRNNWNSTVAAGVYLCRLKTKDQFKVHKMILLDGGSSPASITSSKVKKEKFQNFAKANSIFNYSIKVSGNEILDSEFNDLSCSGDTTLNLLVPKILKSVTVGPEGGKLEIEDFSLTVPEGALSETTELKLALEPDSVDFGGKEYSKQFRVDGLPEFYASDLILKIKTIEQPIDSISIIVVQIDTLLNYNKEYYNLDYHKASYNNGYAELVLPANPSFLTFNNVNKQMNLNSFFSSKKLFIVLSSPGIVFSSNHNFLIYYPKTFSNLVPYIDDILETAIDTVQNLGFHKLPLRTPLLESNWPVKVFISSSSALPVHYKSGLYIQNENRVLLSKYWTINIGPEFNSTEAFLHDLGGSVFNNFIYQNFLFGCDNKANYLGWNSNYWLLTSLALWSEKIFPYSYDYVNSNYNPNVYGELHQHWVKNNWESYIDLSLHGLNILTGQKPYALIPLIEHITRFNERGYKIVYDIYNSIVEHKSSIKGLLKALNDTEHIWWPNFFKEYVQGNIYNAPTEEFLKNTSKTIDFNDGDTLKYVDETYDDLSAKLFKININSDEIRNKALNFKIDPEGINIDYVKTLVFGLSNDKLTFLAEGTDFNVAYFQSYEALIACVVNSGNEPPYTGTSNIDLDIRVTNDLAFKYCDIRLAVIEMHDTVEGVWSPGWYTMGTFKDNVFDGKINTEKQGEYTTGTIRVEVDDNKNILSLDVMAYHSDPTGFSSQWGFNAKNIPPTENEPYLLVYSYLKYDVCNYVKGIYAKYTEVDGSEWEIKNHKCDQESHLHIKFHNWD